MNDVQTAPPAGWFQDPARPWIAHRWDGERWTGEARNDSRTVNGATAPASPPDPGRRIEFDALPRRTPSLAPGLFPTALGLLLTLVLLPRLYDALDSMAYGAAPSDVLPVWSSALFLAGLGIALYGIVVLAVVRATQR